MKSSFHNANNAAKTNKQAKTAVIFLQLYALN